MKQSVLHVNKRFFACHVVKSYRKEIRIIDIKEKENQLKSNKKEDAQLTFDKIGILLIHV
jgi:hypothetical protein